MRSPRRLLRISALVGAVAAAYLAGVVTGVVGTQSPANVRGGGVLDEAADRISRQAATPVSRDELDRAAVQGMLSALGDHYSSYYDASEFASFEGVLDGRYTGVGLWVRRTSSGEVTVTSVQPQSPADQANVQPGDELIAVDGQPVAGSTVAQIVGALRGPAGSMVAVVLKQDGRPQHLTLRRTALVAGDVSVSRIGDNVVRIRVMAFTRGVGKEVRHALAKARADHRAGVILDLRDNPGGLLDEAAETASAFLDGGLVVSYVKRGDEPRHLNALGHGDIRTALAVLVNGGTASAAEVVAGALQDRDRAVIVGSRTFGKGSVQEPSQLADGSGLELTVGRYVTPSGRSLDGVGIEPDIEVPAGAVGGVAESRAVEVLRGLLADNGAAGRG